MTVRTSASAAAAVFVLSALAFAPAHAADIVDQVLPTLPPPPGGARPPPPVLAPSAAPTGASFAPSGNAGFAPPGVSAPAQPAAPVATSSGDIVDRALQAMPAQRAHAPSTPWTGFYAGVNAGGGFTHGGSSVSCVNSVTGNQSGCDAVSDGGGINTGGVLGGAQVGYMAPVSLGWNAPLMLGGEIDIQGSGISGDRTVNGPFAVTGFPGLQCSPCSYTASQKLDWFSTVRARIGLPLDNVLLYGTGGVIFGGVETAQTLSYSGAPGYVIDAKSTKAGPTAGGGIEVLVPGMPLSAKLEALYYDLGSVQTTTVPQSGYAGNFSETKSFGFQGAMVRLGVNYRLGDIGGF